MITSPVAARILSALIRSMSGCNSLVPREMAMTGQKIDYTPEASRLADDFPRWEAWVSLIGGQWHARLKGSEPIAMVHDDSPAGLRAQIETYERHQ